MVYKKIGPTELERLDRAKVKVGTSGFVYKHWRGIFYPEKLPQSSWLEHYMLFFPVVELNVTFYRLPKPETFIQWKNRAREYFSYILKLSRIITHRKRLKVAPEDIERHLGNYRLLEKKLELVLIQLPGNLKYDIGLLKNFIEMLPMNIEFSFEFRSPSWWREDIFELLRERGMGIVITDWKGMPDEYPEGFVIYYVRRHGPTSRYSSSYTEEYLDSLAERLVSLPGRKYVLFNNDFGGYAVQNALYLQQKIVSMLP